MHLDTIIQSVLDDMLHSRVGGQLGVLFKLTIFSDVHTRVEGSKAS